jgi:hypothetical protein
MKKKSNRNPQYLLPDWSATALSTATEDDGIEAAPTSTSAAPTSTSTARRVAGKSKNKPR